MNFIKSIILILITTSIFMFGGLEVVTASSFPSLETKITLDSSSEKIKKLQSAFIEFGLYNGEVDGKYNSIENSLLNYQKKAGLIVNNWDYGAGYFGVQTLKSLQKDYPNSFDKITKKYLLMEQPSKEIRYFYITAYYSPLPNQDKYSYNVYKRRYRTFEEEKRLQGEGKTTASGKSVFTGILAAPKNYKFGTKIEFEGFGIGVVEDRGGAIVNSGERGHEYDRIDIWMGYGDIGLKRATKWGERKVKGKIVPDTRQVSIKFGDSQIMEYADLKVDAENPKKENVVKLQTLLKKVEIYEGVIDGQFANIRDQLIKYQIDNNIIKSKNDPHAGYFGNKTFAALRENYGGEILKDIENNLDEDVVLSKNVKLKLEKLNEKITYMVESKYGKNTNKSIKYRTNLRLKIDKHLKKINSTKRKNELKYLKSLI